MDIQQYEKSDFPNMDVYEIGKRSIVYSEIILYREQSDKYSSCCAFDVDSRIPVRFANVRLGNC